MGRYATGQGCEVLGVDRADKTNYSWNRGYQQSNLVESDLTELIAEFDPDALLHAAGSASVGESYINPFDDFSEGVITWTRILESVRRSGRNPVVVFPSSAAVYGIPEQLPIPESAPITPISPYGFHKASCEVVAREYSQCFDLDIVVTRLFSMYGPRQHRLLLWELFSQSDQSEIVLKGTGTEIRDYLYIDDLSKILLGLFKMHPEKLNIYNVASGEGLQIGEVANVIADLTGKKGLVRVLGQSQPGDPPHWRADVQKIKELGLYTSRPFTSGIEECIKSWQNV